MGALIFGIILSVVGVGLIVFGLLEGEETPAFLGSVIGIVGFVLVGLFVVVYIHTVNTKPAPIHVCSHCSSEIQAKTNKFCPECGTRIEETECPCDKCTEPTTEECTCDNCIVEETTTSCDCDNCKEK